jgi:hypothetical protein
MEHAAVQCRLVRVAKEPLDGVYPWARDRPAQHTPGSARQRSRPVAASARARYNELGGQDDVSNARRVRRVRAGDHSATVNAGLARARANGDKLARRRVKPSIEAQIVTLRDEGYGRFGKKLGRNQRRAARFQGGAVILINRTGTPRRVGTAAPT